MPVVSRGRIPRGIFRHAPSLRESGWGFGQSFGLFDEYFNHGFGVGYGFGTGNGYGDGGSRSIATQDHKRFACL